MACVLSGIDSTWTHRPCRIDISQIRYHIALVLCEIESTYVKSNLRIFDMTWAAKIDSTVKSILAAPDPRWRGQSAALSQSHYIGNAEGTAEECLGFAKARPLKEFHCLEAYQGRYDSRCVAIEQNEPDQRHHYVVHTVVTSFCVCRGDDHRLAGLVR